MSTAESRIFVFGASGFIGRHMVNEARSSKLSFVTRSPSKSAKNGDWLEADLLKPQSLDKILIPGCSVINLAYSASAAADVNLEMADNLARACLRAKVSRLVHCSTAVVAGANKSPVIDECSKCLPSTSYERNKLDIEMIFTDAASCDLKVYILRPTAVVGVGSQNLKKMLSEILGNNHVANFIRSSIHGKRKLNLVPVKDVVRALWHLSEQPIITPGIYICSADNDQDNRYDRVEEIIRALLNKKKRMVSLKLPGNILDFMLKASREGSGKFANRHYSSDKLISTGFQRTEKISDAVREFVLSEVCGVSI